MDATTTLRETDHHFLDRESELGRLIAEFDWSSTPLGPFGRWPQIIKTTLALILRSPVPVVTLWGERGVMLYNDAYAEFAGGRHPGILGRDVLDAWPEAAEWNAGIMDKVFHHGGTVAVQDQQLTLRRRGVGEPVWMNLDYSPIVDESGARVGVIA